MERAMHGILPLAAATPGAFLLVRTKANRLKRLMSADSPEKLLSVWNALTTMNWTLLTSTIIVAAAAFYSRAQANQPENLAMHQKTNT